MPRPDPTASACVAAFAAALEDRDRDPPASVRVARGDLASRFAVYRNNVWVARLGVLDALFPVTLGLVGEAFFHELARRFFREAAPANPVAQEWAPPFVDWLAACDAAVDRPWLVDVARLEAVRLAAYDAAEATPIGPAALADIAPEALVARRVRLHPSLGLVASSASIGAIWAAHHDGGAPHGLDATVAQTVLVVRPTAEVVTTLVAPGEASFVAALLAGATLGDAIEAAFLADPDFDPGARLVGLLHLGAIVGID